MGPAYQAAVKNVYAAWCDWCKANGRDHPGTAATFGRDLRAAVPDVKVGQPREDGARVRVYEGLGLNGSY